MALVLFLLVLRDDNFGFRLLMYIAEDKAPHG